MYQRPTTPQSIGGVLDNGFKLFKESFQKLILLAFIGALISSLPTVYMTQRAQEVISDPQQGADAVQQLFGPAFFGLTIVTVFVSLVIFTAIISRLDAIANGRSCSIGDALGVGLRRFPAVFIAGLLYGLLVAIGILLLVVPGILVSVSLYGATILVVTDKIGPLAAIKESHRLVWGDWWRTATVLTIALIIGMVLFVLIGIVAGLVAITADEATDAVLTPLWYDLLATPVLTAVATPLFYALPYAVLQDLKLRRGGQDLMQRAESLKSA